MGVGVVVGVGGGQTDWRVAFFFLRRRPPLADLFIAGKLTYFVYNIPDAHTCTYQKKKYEENVFFIALVLPVWCVCVCVCVRVRAGE